MDLLQKQELINVFFHKIQTVKIHRIHFYVELEILIAPMLDIKRAQQTIHVYYPVIA